MLGRSDRVIAATLVIATVSAGARLRLYEEALLSSICGR
jgi:hypothetical protein